VGMESALDPVLGAAFPVFALILCGVLAGRFRLINPGSSEALNRFVYTFALPAMLFMAVYRGSLDELLGSGSFLLAVTLATLGTALAGFAFSSFAWRAQPAESVLRALNASFANTGYLGIPLVSVAYGEGAALPAALAGVARSPLIWPIALAVLLVALQVKVPLPVERFATLLAAAAGPCALFAIGLFVSQLSIRQGLRSSWPSTMLKLVLHPLVMAALALYLLPVDPFWAKVGIVCASLPLGATAFVLAQRYRLLEAETSTGAVFSTAASVLTVSLVMFLLAGR